MTVCNRFLVINFQISFYLCAVFTSVAQTSALRPLASFGGPCYAAIPFSTQGTPHLAAGLGTSLVLFDVSVPDKPGEVARLWLGSPVRDIAIQGNRLYALCVGAGVRIIDVSNPQSPKVMSTYAPDRGFNGMSVSGDRLYLNHGRLPLEAVDVADPSHPTLIFRDTLPANAIIPFYTKLQTFGMSAEGGLALVPMESRGLWIYDISGSGMPKRLAIQPGKFTDVVRKGNVAFAANGVNRIYAIDLTDPANPQLRDSLKVTNAWRIAIHSDIAYVSGPYGSSVSPGYKNQLHLIDVSKPDSLAERDSLSVEAGLHRFSGTENTGWLAQENLGFRSLALSNGPPYAWQGESQYPAWSGSFQFSGSHSVFRDTPFSLRMVNLSDPAHPVFGDRYGNGGRLFEYILSGNDLVVNTSSAPPESTMVLIDIADRQHPVAKSAWQGGMPSLYIRENGYAFMQNALGRFSVEDISNQETPVWIGPEGDTGHVSGIRIYQSKAFVSYDTRGIRIWSISGSKKLILEGNFQDARIDRIVAVAEGRAYLLTLGGGLLVLDISSAAKPLAIGNLDSLPEGKITGWAIRGGRAYASLVSGGFAIVDVTAPDSMKTIAVSEFKGTSEAITLMGDFGYAFFRESGIQVFPLDFIPSSIGRGRRIAGAFQSGKTISTSIWNANGRRVEGSATPDIHLPDFRIK